jgi:hypothetical protein
MWSTIPVLTKTRTASQRNQWTTLNGILGPLPLESPDHFHRNTHARQVLAEAAVLVPKGIVCLISALQFHQLTLQMPSSVWMAIRAQGVEAYDQLPIDSIRSF